MFTCYICKVTFAQENTLVKHLRLEHCLYEGAALTLGCCFPPCPLTFKTFSGFRRHIKRCSFRNHNQQANINKLVLTKSHSGSNINCDENVSDKNNLLLEDASCYANLIKNPLQLNTAVCSKNILENFISNLLSLGIPDTTIQTIIDSVSELFESLSDVDDDSKNVLMTCRSALDEFKSKHLRKKYFHEKIVSPVQVPIGIRFDQRWDKSLGQYVQLPITYNLTYIPIRETLKYLLQNESFSALVMSNSQNNSLMTSYRDGSIYKKTALFSQFPDSLQIQLYYDEFETVNPLGSKTGGHKVGAIYFIIRNLPAVFNSVLHNIHLLALFYAVDLKRFGFNKILEQIVLDLKHIETVGIYNASLDTHIKGTLIGISHDNLGGNQIMGFVESFSAEYVLVLKINRDTIEPTEAVQMSETKPAPKKVHILQNIAVVPAKTSTVSTDNNNSSFTKFLE